MKNPSTQFLPSCLRGAHAIALALAMWLLPAAAFGQNRIIIDGTDANDHGSASGGVNLNGWRYMQKALEALAPQVANGKKVVVDLGTKPGQQARNAIASAFALSNLPPAGWTIVYINGTTDIATFLDGGTVGGITVNDVGLLYMPTASSSAGDLSPAEIATINARAAAVANLVNNLGAALFAMGEEGAGRWGWLTSLIGTVTPVAGSATGLTLTADGQAAFPGLTSADLSTGPWHNYFTGNFGSLKVLANASANRAVILGGIGVASSSFQFSAASISADEAVSPLVVTVTRTGITTSAQTVEFLVSGGTAARGPDFTLADGTLSFAAGETEKTISLAITSDALDEADETIVLTLRNASVGAAIGAPGATTITVVDDDPTPTLTIADVTITETLSGTSVATFPVQLSAASGRSVTVNFATTNGTALAPADYAAQSGTLTFNPGDTSKTIGVVINGDVLPEQTEDFTVALTAPVNASLARAVATGSIVNAAADLRVESFVVQPLPAFFGQTVSVTWTIRNAGNVPAATGWDDRLVLATTANPTAADLVLLTRSTSDLAALGAGGTYTRQQNVTLPFGAALVAGEYHVVLVADSGAVLAESDETNNTAATVRLPVAFPPDLQVSDVLPTDDVTAGEAIQIRWKVRNTGLGSTVGTWSDRVIVRNVTANRVLLDTLVSSAGPIAPGGVMDRQLAFTVPTGNDGVGQLEISVAADSANVVFEQNATATAEANNSAAITLTSNGPRALTLTLAAPTITEGASLGGSVSIPVALAAPLTVTLGVSQANRLTFPATVIIPAGQLSANFTVQAVQNTNVDAAIDLTLIASAPAHLAATFALRILDDDAPAITFTLDRNLVSEAAGSAAVLGTLTLDRAVASGLVAQFTVAPAGQIVVPSSVAVPADTLSVPVTIGVMDNVLAEGNRTVTITARLAPAAGGAAIATAAPVDLIVTDDEGASLSLAFDRALLVEGRNPAGNGIVTRIPAGPAPLIVDLISADPATLIVPASVTIPGGQSSATFPVQTPNDAQPNGNRPVAVTASATDYNPASASVIVTDLQKPDLTVALIEPPTGAQTEAWIDVRVLTTNHGATAAPGPFAQRILLSSDAAIGGDTLLSQSNFTGVIPAGAFIEQSLRVKLPRDAGRYWLVAETDAGAVVDEALENNNAAISSAPLDLAPAYAATLTIVPASVPAGTAIPITGSATLTGGAPAAFMLVNIHITSPGAKRVISALTNSIGQFAASFTPMPGEGGLFQFGAAHPGLATAPVQDEVRVFGLRAEPGSLDLSLSEQASQTGTVLIRNLTDVPISGLAATVSGLPAGVQFTPALSATTVPAGGTVSLDYTVSTTGPLDRTTFNIALTSAPGATLNVPVAITVAALQPRLVAVPGSLESGMLRGQQLLLNFQLRNDGGAPTGPVNLLLPTGLSWMRLISPLPLAPLAPGEAITVTLQLLPPVDLPLEEFSGRFIAREGTRSLAIPFSFRALSDRFGRLVVRAEDEFTYYAQGNPPLAGATVVVTDPLTQQAVATATTDASGTVNFPNLREGYYAIEATANQHTRFRATRFVSPGIDNHVRAFLSRQTVTYDWTVTPTTVEDRYRVTIDTTFETAVPAPVITIEPAFIDLAGITHETIIPMKISNHGLIAAEQSKLVFGQHPLWRVTPLIEDVGTLPAMSSITIPVRIEPIFPAPPAPGLAGAAFPAPAISIPCILEAGLNWSLVCGPDRRS